MTIIFLVEKQYAKNIDLTQKKAVKKKSRGMKMAYIETNSKMADVNLTISIVTLNIRLV